MFVKQQGISGFHNIYIFTQLGLPFRILWNKIVELNSFDSPKTYPCWRNLNRGHWCHRDGVSPVNVNGLLSITPLQTHLIQLLFELEGRLAGMQINPQVNTNIIRSVTLQHCPRGMREFHPEGSRMGDNSDNQVPSESHPQIVNGGFMMTNQTNKAI